MNNDIAIGSSNISGRGVFARRAFRKGEIVMEPTLLTVGAIMSLRRAAHLKRWSEKRPVDQFSSGASR
jgi:hypothetical protein